MQVSIKKICAFMLCCILGYNACLVIPFFLNVGVVIIVTVRYRLKVKKYLLWGFVAGSSMRILVVVIMLLYYSLHPQYLPDVSVGLRRYVVLGSDIGLFEGIVRYYSENIGKYDYDRFSGNAFLKAGPLIYSVGPDGDDDKIIIIYDPTNGTSSNGDIIISKP